MSRGNLKKMEKFSDFFNSINSNAENTNDSPASDVNNNNDNIIYNSNNIYNIEDESKIFPTEDYYLIANEIILGAVRLHYELYDSFIVPYAFIAFYFKEFGKHAESKSYYLKKFLLLFENKKNNIANAITIINKTYKNHTEIKFIKKASLFKDLKQGYYLDVTRELAEKVIAYNKNIDNNLKTAIDETREIMESISNTASDANIKYNYIDFLSRSNGSDDAFPTITEIDFEEPKESPKQVEVRKKKMIAPPKQDRPEKISNITLPRLKIGKPYITSFSHSRIDSAFFAFRFLEPHEAYALINKYKFIAVKFTKGFETKRKSLFETKKSSFDLF